MKSTVAAVAAMLAISGCTTTGLSNPTPTTAAPPTVARAAPSGIIAAMQGGLIGGTIGAELDSADRQSALQAEYRALEHTPNGQKVTWKSQSSARYGEVVAAQPYRVGSQDCRQYNHTVFGSAGSKVARGTACRNPDGSWTPLT